jgi:ABC-2 type transport system ATP-binding protein
VDRLADRLAIIDHGAIVAEGTPSSLKADIGGDIVTVALRDEPLTAAPSLLDGMEGLREIRRDESGLTLFVDDGTAAVAQVVRILDSARVPMGAVSVSQPTLDEVFLRATGSRLEGAQVNGGRNNGAS